jgi:nucleoside-diphosphate-sugar epimerase
MMGGSIGPTALLIGGTGPTGPHIIKGLTARGYRVTVLNRGTRTVMGSEDLELLVADPHFIESLEPALAGRRFDLVIASYGRLRLMPTLLSTCTDRVITIGGTAYADTAGLPADEDAPREISNKLVARVVETEKVLESAHAEGLFRHTHLRYPLLWGPGQLAPREWSIVRRVRDGRHYIPVVDGARTIESRCYVVNAANAVLTVIDRPEESAGKTYNVADDHNPDDARRVLDLCAALGRADIALANFPQQVTGPAGFWGIGRDLDTGGEQRRPASTRHRLVDTRRIRADLGLRDAIPYPAAVRATAQHYLAHPLAPGGEEEQMLGDPFDYEAEDRLIDELERFEETSTAIPFEAPRFIHQYDHPKSVR